LNIKLPYEQEANPFIEEDPKLISFKYFFTRKLFFLRESDAIALFPGGFGTLDEALETLTLCQTGKYGPVPMVLVDRPGGTYWQEWDRYLRCHLVANGLISPEDTSLYTLTDSIDTAIDLIRRFYCVYHSSRYVNEQFVMRLKFDLCDSDVDFLNREFADIIISGEIKKTLALPEESGDPTEDLPRLVFNFNQRNFGRLYQMIGAINQMRSDICVDIHPETK
jgi:hypothetical protein